MVFDAVFPKAFALVFGVEEEFNSFLGVEFMFRRTPLFIFDIVFFFQSYALRRQLFQYFFFSVGWSTYLSIDRIVM